MSRVTLSDVAALAGVSTGTVSKYINGVSLKPGNEEKIRQAIERLEYTPSTLARSLASGKSYTILLMIITESPIVTSTWLHELPIIHGLMDALNNSDYSLKIEIDSLDDNEKNIRKIDNYARGKSVDGIVLLSSWELDLKLIHPLEYYNIPFVIIGSDNSGRNTNYIDFDNQQPIVDIIQDMYQRGGRVFSLIGGFETQRHMVYRTKGFQKALRALDLDDSSIVFGDYSIQSGYTNALRLLQAKTPPDAIVCGNDNIAAGVLRAAHELHISVPDRLMISGFDDTVVCQAVSPALTSVSAPSYEMGKSAGSELLEKLKSSEHVINNLLLHCTVRFRESTQRN